MQNDKGGKETVLRLFDLASGKEVKQFPLGTTEWYFSLAFSPDGKALACGRSERSFVLEVATGRVLHRLAGHTGTMAFSPDGKTLLASADNGLRLWDAVTGQERRERIGGLSYSPATAMSPDGRLLATAGWGDREVSLWDTASGRLVRRLPLAGERRYVRNLAFSSDGRALAACQYKGFIQLWDTATGKQRGAVQLADPNHPNK